MSYSLLTLYFHSCRLYLVFVSGAVQILIVIPDNLPVQISRVHSFFGAEQEICIEIGERRGKRKGEREVGHDNTVDVLIGLWISREFKISSFILNW